MSKKNDQVRAEFLADHHEFVTACFHAAIADEVAAPVVMLIDPEDSTGEAIIEELADCIPIEARARAEADEIRRGIVFAMPFDQAIHRLESVCQNCVTFLEQTQSVKSQIDKAGRLMMYMVVSYGMIDCKLEPHQAHS